jgi:hypothetical protein
VHRKQKKRISYIPSCEEGLTSRLLAKKGPQENHAAFVNFLVLGDWNPQRTRASYSPEDWERLVGAQGPLRPKQPLPLQPQHPAFFGAGVRSQKKITVLSLRQ